MLFVVGYGPLEISDIKLGETDIENFDAEVEARSGYSTDDPLTLYTNQVIENSQQIELTYNDWIERRTELDCDEGSVDITFPSGLAIFDTEGGKFNRTVEFDIEYRKVGSADWLPNADPTIEELCPPFSDWTLGNDIPGNDIATYAAGVIDFPEEGAYALSPKMLVNYSPTFDFAAKYYSDTPSVEFTPDAGYYAMITFWGRGGFNQVKNSDGFKEQPCWNSYATGGWDADAVSFNGGNNVHMIQVKLQAGDVHGVSSTAYQIKEPSVTTSYTNLITSRNTKMIRRYFHWVYPEAGQYDVRIRRNTAMFTPTDDYPDCIEDAYWTAFRSIRQDEPINRAGLATIALKIKATSQLNGPIDQLNCIATSVLPVWNGAAWVDTATSNPAWAFCDVLRGGAVASTIADTEINKTAIKAWADLCGAFELNAIFDSRVTRYDALQSIASVGRASFQVLDGVYTVCHDILPKTSVVQHFTPRNSWGFSGSISCAPVPQAIKARFINADQGYVEDTRWIFDDGYDEATATVIEEMFMWGITDADQVWREGRYHIAVAKLRASAYTLNCDMEHLVCTRGDLVRVGHDVPMWGLGFGRIKSVTFGAGVSTVVVDTLWPYTAGERYHIRVRTNTGATSTYPMLWEGETGDFDTFTVGVDVTASWHAGDLIQFGRNTLATVECLVQSIHPTSNLNAEITLIENELGIYTAPGGDIPDHESKVTLPPDTQRFPDIPSVHQIRGDESVAIRTDTGWRVRILIEFHPISSASLIPRYIEGEFKLHGTDDKYTRLPIASYDSLEMSVEPVEVGETYDVRVRYITEYGRASEWLLATGDDGFLVQGDITAPPDVSTLYFEPPSILKWSFPNAPPDFAGFELRYNDGNNSIWSVGTKAFDALLQATYIDIGSFTGGTKTWMVKALDFAGNESDTAATLIREMGDYPTKYVIETEDFQAADFPGVITGGTQIVDDLVADDMSDFWGDVDTEPFWLTPDSDDFWGDSYYTQMVYAFDYTPAAGDIPSDLWFTMTTTALDYIAYRYSLTDEWHQWPGSIEAQNVPTYFQIVTLQGNVEGRISDLTLNLDANVIEEYFNDTVIASGGARLPLTKTYRAIKTVLVTLQDDAGTAVSWKVIDKDETLGPEIECYNVAGADTAGTIDAQVRGY
jgi:hypothetical protein